MRHNLGFKKPEALSSHVTTLRAAESVGQFSESQILVRSARIELAPAPWQGAVLPLNYDRVFYAH